MKIYTIRGKWSDGVAANVVDLGEKKRREYPLQHHVRHSPDGFEYGYNGSGPTDLALSILWDLFNEEPKQWLYMALRAKFIGPADRKKPLIISEEEIKDWISQICHSRRSTSRQT